MASGDATPFPVKNQAYRVTFPIFDADGDLVAGAAGLDSEISKDGGTFADVTAEATQIATSSGMYYLDLTATEMNADTVAIIVKTSTSGAKTTPIVLYPQTNGIDRKVDVTHWNGTAVATPTVAGVPEVDLTHMAGGTQTVTDLKDFADAGYDPATNKVQGVVLVDTTTTNTDMVGTDSAALASVCTEARLAELDAANLPTDVAAIPTTAMRGTDSAALASVCTETRLAELDAANLPTDIAAIPTTAMRGTDNAALASVATEARLAELDAVNLPTDIAAIPTTAMRGTDNAALASVATEARLAELDAANLPADVAAIPTTAMRGTDSAATAAALATAQLDLDKVTGADGATLATAQGNYAPSKAGDAMTLTSGERDATAAALLDLADSIETGTTVRLALRFMAGVLVGESSNDGKTFEGIGVETTRVTTTMSGKDRVTVVLA